MGGEWEYLFLIGLAAFLGSAYFTVFFYIRHPNRSLLLKTVAILGGIIVLSVFLGRIFSTFLYVDTSASFVSRYEYFFSLFFLYFIVSLLELIKPSIVLEKNLIAESLIIFSFFSRFACLSAGCCAGKLINGLIIPIPYLEMTFSLLAFITLKLLTPFIKAENSRLDSLSIYVLFYAIFRLITEFFRLNYGVRQIGAINLRQFLSIILVIYIISDFIIKRRGNNDKKIS